MEFKCPLIIVDFGTAITFDVVSQHGNYLGGLIVPGLRIALEALNKRTAQLPKTSFSKPPNVIGKSTVESIQSGAYYGNIHMISGLIESIKKDLSARISVAEKDIKVIATGGDGQSLSQAIASIDVTLPDLTLRGIVLALLHSEYAYET